MNTEGVINEDRNIDIDGVRINFEKGWGLIRKSNTTPVLVTHFESEDENLVQVYKDAINKLIMQVR